MNAEVTIVEVLRGHVMSSRELAAFRDPEKLVASRHLFRNSDGKLEARRDFKFTMPATV